MEIERNTKLADILTAYPSLREKLPPSTADFGW